MFHVLPPDWDTAHQVLTQDTFLTKDKKEVALTATSASNRLEQAFRSHLRPMQDQKHSVQSTPVRKKEETRQNSIVSQEPQDKWRFLKQLWTIIRQRLQALPGGKLWWSVLLLTPLVLAAYGSAVSSAKGTRRRGRGGGSVWKSFQSSVRAMLSLQ